MSKNSKFVTYALMTVAILLAGCASKQEAAPVKQICLSGVHIQKVMQAAGSVLSEMHFTIAKADAEQGFIKTKPLSGGQWFEFWRSDNVGADNYAEANIQDIRRTVELNIGPQDNKLCVNCIVTVQRLSLPQRRITSSEQASSLFTKSDGSMQRLKFDAEQKKTVAWIDLGQDTALETEILKRLERKITK